MKLRFFGPLGRVTGSCAMLWDEARDFRALVDCGMQQGEGDVRANREPFPFDASRIGLVLLTHAHVDHSGLLPKLVREGFRGEVVCTPETAKLSRVLLEDSARLSDLYTAEDVRRLRFRPLDGPFGCRVRISNDVYVQLYRSAHILGAVSIRVSWGPRREARSIVFSGDLGTNVQGHEHALFLRHRMSPDPSDFAVVESTYGDRVRDPKPESFFGRTEALRRELLDAVDRGGPVLMPAFAVDRIPALLLDLAYVFGIEPRLWDVPVFVHSSLGRECARIYADAVGATDVADHRLVPRWLSESAFARLGLDSGSADDVHLLAAALRATFDPTGATKSPLPELRPVHRWINRVEQTSGPRVIVAASGMCEGGAVLAHLPSVLVDPRATLISTGYVSRGSVARRVFELARLSAADRARVGGHIVLPDGRETRIARASIRCELRRLHGYSAHADQHGLLQWLFHEYHGKSRRAASTVFIQHGEDASRRALADAITHRDPGVKVVLPRECQRDFDLDAAVASTTPSVEELIARVEALERAVAALQQS